MTKTHQTATARRRAQRPDAAHRRGPGQANAVERASLINAVAEPPVAPAPQRHLRPARSLIGWLPPGMSQQLLARNAEPPVGAEIVARAGAAQAAVAARQPHGPEAGVVTDLPNDQLAGYVDELKAQAFYQASFAAEGGWQVRMADLRRVRSLQPLVHTDHATDRTRSAVANDLLSLARITLPHSRTKDLIAAAPTADGRGWVLTCRNPQLRVRGPCKSEVEKNGYKTDVFGIETEIPISLMQVAHWRGAYILRDGYHRAYGLLSRGINSVPVLYREFPDLQAPAAAPSLFDPTVYLGERAPLLIDYLDDSVSANIEVFHSQKTLVIQVQVGELDIPIL